MSTKLPSVLACQRGTVLTDGRMSSIVVDDDGVEKTHLPVYIMRHGIRGINTKEGAGDVSNVQRTESAKTHTSASGLMVEFGFRSIPFKHLLFACADQEYRVALTGFMERFFSSGVNEFDEVTRRMARNILNGRWLWRNQLLGEVTVSAQVGDRTYSGQGSRKDDFDNYTKDEIDFASNVIQAGLHGAHVPAQITGRVMFGFNGSVEVFPSQNMVTNKPKGFARSLYKADMISRKELLSIMQSANKDGEDAGDFAADMIVMGRAVLRDQKIGSAIRTIDTWYKPQGDLLTGAEPVRPIAIEPNGASLEFNTFNRSKANDAKAALTKVKELIPAPDALNPQAAYLIGLLIRGGVFSESKD